MLYFRIKYNDIINEYANDIINSEKFISQKKFRQHRRTSLYDHTLNVACYSLKIADKYKIKVDKSSLIRGCLLHDYYFYDWHIRDKSHRLHGFSHAGVAMRNACKDYELNEIEKNMIYTHMFPVNLRIPKYKESIILCISDKICAIIEFFI